MESNNYRARTTTVTNDRPNTYKRTDHNSTKNKHQYQCPNSQSTETFTEYYIIDVKTLETKNSEFTP